MFINIFYDFKEIYVIFNTYIFIQNKKNLADIYGNIIVLDQVVASSGINLSSSSELCL